MKPQSVLLYQFGNKAAIRDVAGSKYTLVTSVILVLCTALARNHDQTYWRENWVMFLFGSLIFSLFSGSFLFLVYLKSIRPQAAETMSLGRDYLTFMGLFWMTAPIAWLYALPAERLLESLPAARMNLALLGIVSVWRVWLITRVLSVLTHGGIWPILVRVLLVAACEVLVVIFFGGAFAQRIMSSMSGMRNSPEEELVLSVLGSVFGISLLAVPALAIASVSFAKLQGQLRGLPVARTNRIPVLTLGGTILFWVLVAIGPQEELARNAAVERLVDNGEYRKAVDYLSRHSPEDFAPARRLPPDPYNFPLYEDLPGLIQALDGTEAAWVREHYLGYLDISFSHRSYKTFYTEQWAAILKSLDQLPEGPEWITRNSEEIAERLTVSRSRNEMSEFSTAALKSLKEKYNLQERKQ